MESLKKAASTAKKLSSGQGADKTTKKQKSSKKRKVKRKPEKDAEKISSSPDCEVTDQPSDNPDQESDAVSLKDFAVDKPRTDIGKRPTSGATTPHKETSHSKSANEVVIKGPKGQFGKSVGTLKSQSVTKIKGQSSQSTRLKESSSNMSLSTKSSKSTSSLGINISSTALTPSDSRLHLDTASFTRKEIPKNESLRWENICSDSDEEQDRLKLYKLNRRKRYLAAANKKYSDWIATLNGSTHSLSSTSNHHMEGDYSSSTDSIKHSNSATTNNFVKTINTMQEGFVPGIRQDISLRSSGSQMMLNC